MTDHDRRYAGLILGTGVNLREGQCLLLRADACSRRFARLMSSTAYGMGARWVEVAYEDQALERARLDHSSEDYLEFVPDFVAGRAHEIVSQGWAVVSLRGPEHPDIMEGVDPARLGRARKAISIAGREYMSAIASNLIQWNVCLYPTAGWSRKVLGDTADWEEGIWRVLDPILRLDEEDAPSRWLSHDGELKRRCRFLNDRSFDRFVLTGPGTRLQVGMAPGSRFAGGRCVSSSGVGFFPNIPTEEVFSTPDFRRTEGRLTCTRPLYLMGARVEEPWFVFREGAVVECGASRGSEVLERYLETDAQARYLGEIALVGGDSPIYRSGLLFHNVLLDENAACHVALGNGYTDTVEGASGKTDRELLEMGCNVSLVHTDFMFGSPGLSVRGLGSDGTETTIMRDGEFVI